MTRRTFLCAGASGACALVFPKALRFEDAVFDRILAHSKSENWPNLPMGELVGRIGLEFLGTAYVGQTLETSDSLESCVVNFEGLDCVTFFESSLGIARMLKRGQGSLADLRREITLTRYRGGKLDGYLSRLHYTSEWMADNAKKGTVKNVTADLPGAVRFEKTIDFMSTHPGLYRQLKANPLLLKPLARIEQRLTASVMHHVPKDAIASAEDRLQTGDIVGITTSTPGIDCSHTGICFRDEKDALRFLHASSTAKKVVLGPRLSDYVSRSPKALGVMITRPSVPSRK